MRRVLTSTKFEQRLQFLEEAPEATEYLAMVIDFLAAKKTLPAMHHNHRLTAGRLRGFYSVIVGWIPLNPDRPEDDQLTFILLYVIDGDTIFLHDIGQHDDVYESYRN
jgi:mRNA-degrading endonuclease YafQ of YafQ-DinJ toxin-antitoxin module